MRSLNALRPGPGGQRRATATRDSRASALRGALRHTRAARRAHAVQCSARVRAPVTSDPASPALRHGLRAGTLHGRQDIHLHQHRLRGKRHFTDRVRDDQPSLDDRIL